MNTFLFLLLVLGVPAVAYFRARWLEAGIYQRQVTKRVLAEIDFERYEAEMGEAR